MSARALRAGRAFIEFALSDKGVQSGLLKIERRLHATGEAMHRLGNIGIAAGGAIMGSLAAASTVFAGFDDQMRVVKGVTGATREEFALLTDEAQRLGATTSFSASQVAAAMAELGRAGFDPRQILNSTEAVLALSRATDTELPRAAEIGGAALRGFALDATEMGRVSDVLTATANGTAQTLEDLFEALKPVAPIAAEAGDSIEDTAAAVGILANNGIKGSLAGNALARAYKNLATTRIQDQLAGVGVNATDAEGNLRPLVEIIGDLGKATQDFAEAPRLALFEKVFGRGQAAALKLAQASSGAYQELVAKIRDSGGQAINTAAEMDAGIGGSFRRVKSAVEGLAISVGDALAPTLSRLADIISGVTGSVTEFVAQNNSLVVGVASAGAGIAAMGALAKVAGIALSVASAAAGVFSTVIGAVGTVIATPVLAIPALIAAIGGLVDWLFFGGAATKWLGKTIASIFGEIVKTIGYAINTAIGWMKDFATAVFGFSESSELEGMNEELAKSVELAGKLETAELGLPSGPDALSGGVTASELKDAQEAAAAQQAAALSATLQDVARDLEVGVSEQVMREQINVVVDQDELLAKADRRNVLLSQIVGQMRSSTVPGGGLVFD